MRVLILNSDSPRNRGDRAILAGLIRIARDRWPGAEITSLSQYADRDQEWFNIPFIPQSPYSINPVDYFRLLRVARKSDVILWGGGEILKDYTNRLGLFYWALKIFGVSMVNHSIYGAFQGIGPTSATMSRRIIRSTVNRTQGFIVRDSLSASRLNDWGVTVPVTSSFDPAILAPVATWDEALQRRVCTSLSISETFLQNTVGVGVRPWFHYKQGGWLPFSLKNDSTTSPEFLLYRTRLVELVDRLTEDPDVNILFVPMHMSASEGDDGLAHDIVDRMRDPRRARVLDEDVFSPSELSAVVGRCRYFISSRLHSAILSAQARVPAVVLYYVDKGRMFYDQMGMQEYAFPIEILLRNEGLDQLLVTLNLLSSNRNGIVRQIDQKISRMSEQMVDDARTGWPIDLV